MQVRRPAFHLRSHDAGGYTLEMDAVRFGRALGFGARQAAKTLVKAADAAAAANPSAPTGRREEPSRVERPPTPRTSQRPVPIEGQTSVSGDGNAPTGPQRAAKEAARTVVQARNTQKGLKRGVRLFGEAAWSPVVRLSGVLWLEVTGVFFGIFALSAGMAVWRMRGAWHAGAAGHRSVVGAAAIAMLFGYFCVSSFVRARRRERGQ
jgi:hypothetical protein